MALGIRGANPIWAEFDLEGNLFDDTFYLYVLQNTLPYLPATVYHDPDLSLPWTNPIQFLANGTLPVDIFFESDVVYRLEFRQNLGVAPPSQNDPLIYEVNNYIAGSGGSTPIDTVAFASSNQITNPQFSLISFSSPFTLSAATNPDPIEVAPGWFLELAGTGNVTLEQVPLNNTLENPSNAPYALRLTLVGWDTDGVFLRQRFQQNGMLWANKIVSSTVTARIGPSDLPQNISADLIDSNGTTLTRVLEQTPVTGSFSELTGHGSLPATSNPDVPPAAYIDYKMSIPSNIDLYVTSFQLVVQDLPIEPSFEQDTIDRQIDHTFHYYRDSLLRQQKESILTGWDFGLNPWQAYPVTTTNLATFGYTADQTIMIQQAYVASATGNNISTARGSAAEKYGFKVASVTATNQFAMIQYIDPATIRDGWGKNFSALLKLVAQLQNPAATVRLKMKLIWRTSLPSAISQTEPITTWAASGEPVFAAGWTAINSINNRVYSLVNGANSLLFEGFSLPAASSTTMTLGIVVYTVDSMLSSGTPDNILFEKCSLVQNDFAIDTPSLTYDETLRRCQYYYETSFEPGGASLTTGPQRVSLISAVYEPQNAYFNQGAATVSAFPNGFGVQYKVIKRANPTLGIYSGVTTTVGKVWGVLNGSSAAGSNEVDLATFYTTFGVNGVYGFSYRGTGLSTMVAAPGGISSSTAGTAGILYHYIANSRLGV